MTVPRADSTMAARVKKVEDELRRIKIAASVTQSAAQPSAVAKSSVWYDSSAGNKPLVFDGTAWVPVRDETIAVAQSTADTAQSTAASAVAATGTLQIDLDAAEAAVAAAQAGVNTLTGTTLPTLQTQVDAILPITETDISDDAITTPKIAAGAITAAEIAALAVTTSALAANAVTAAKIAAGTITASEIAASTITGSQLSATAIDGKTITGALIRTAASGKRVEVSSTNIGAVTFYSGSGSEIHPGQLDVATSQMLLQPPDLGSGQSGLLLKTNAGVPYAGLFGTEIAISGTTFKFNGDDVAIVGPYWYGYLATSPAALASGAVVDITTWTADGTPNSSGITHSAGVFTVPTAGRYRITPQLTYPASNTTGSRVVEAITGSSGGTILVAGASTGNAANITSAYGSKTVRLAAGATFRIVANQGSGLSLSLVAGVHWSFVQIEWVGP